MTTDSGLCNVQLELRWAAFTTAFKLMVRGDYDLHVCELDINGLTGDIGEDVRTICKQFHPINEISQFPPMGSVFLFWRFQPSGDYAFMRIRRDARALAANSLRIALEYCCVLLSENELATFGNDPFYLDEAGAFDAIATQLDNGSRALIPVPVAQSIVVPRLTSIVEPWNGPYDATEANRVSFRSWISKIANSGNIPESFATWWVRDKEAPGFVNVLRAEVANMLTRSEAEGRIKKLADDLQSELVSVNDTADRKARKLTNSITTKIERLEDKVSSDLRDAGRLEKADFQRNMEKSALSLTQTARTIRNLTYRLGPVLQHSQSSALSKLATECETLASDFKLMPHPDPRQNTKKPQPDRQIASESLAQHIRLGAVAVTVAIVAGAILIHPTGPKPGPRLKPSPPGGHLTLTDRLLASAQAIKRKACEAGYQLAYHKTTTDQLPKTHRTDRTVDAWISSVLNTAYKSAGVIRSDLTYSNYSEYLANDHTGLLQSVRASIEKGRDKRIRLRIVAEGPVTSPIDTVPKPQVAVQHKKKRHHPAGPRRQREPENGPLIVPNPRS
ncbi:MAG: hypothetical protein ACLQVD_21740 [Capsulimonadaceae bacterium]